MLCHTALEINMKVATVARAKTSQQIDFLNLQGLRSKQLIQKSFRTFFLQYEHFIYLFLKPNNFQHLLNSSRAAALLTDGLGSALNSGTFGALMLQISTNSAGFGGNLLNSVSPRIILLIPS